MISLVVVVLALSTVDVLAFNPNSPLGALSRQGFHCRTSLSASNWFGPVRIPKPPSAKPPTVDDSSSDVSIPYDAAARLAYDEWRAQYNKGAFNEKKFINFKSNYQAITVANVITKRNAREAGLTTPPALLSLNEYADCSPEEFQAKQKSSNSISGDVLGKAFEAAQSQFAASSALAEAAEALAEEEELLASQLGLESVDELEVALDSLEGIAADGGELDKENLAREARVRSAYLEWCKEYGKQPVESRFSTFASNFLAMESYAKESGREMSLNKFADCTEDEYLELTGQRQKNEMRSLVTETVNREADEDQRSKAALEAKAEAEKQARDAQIAKKKAELEAWQKMSDEERKVATEKEREERRAAQAKALEKLRQQNQAEAIAAAKAEQEKEARQIAMRREIEKKAADLVRQRAREFAEKQELQEKLKQKESPTLKKKSQQPRSFFAFNDDGDKGGDRKTVQEKKSFELTSLFGGLAQTPPKNTQAGVNFPFFNPTESKEKEKSSRKVPSEAVSELKAPEKTKSKPETPVSQKSAPFSLFAPPAPSSKTAPKKGATFTFFGGITAPKAAPRLAASPAPPSKPPARSVAPKPASPEPKQRATLTVFGGISAPKTAPRPAVTPAPAKPPARSVPSSSKGSFSFFTAKPASTQELQPAPLAVPQKPKNDFLSFFGSPKPVPIKTPTPKVSAPPSAAKKEPFTLFAPSKPAAKVATSKGSTPPAAAPPKSGVFSLFGAPKQESVKPVAPKAPKSGKLDKQPSSPKAIPASAAARQIRGTISLTQLAKEEAKQSPFSFFGPKTVPKDNIPVLSRWVQNKDGSITGFVTNSKSFRDNTRITTSPVRIGVKPGQIVKTGSGSQYRLN